MEQIKIPIYITDDDATKFMLFMEHYDLFVLLLEKGVFEQKKAAITLHFDHLGELQTIQRADFMYSKQFEKLSTVVQKK